MHAECLRGLAEVWASMQAPGLTPMQFTEALRLLNEHVAEALAGAAPPWQASEVLMRLRAFATGLISYTSRWIRMLTVPFLVRKPSIGWS